MYVSDFNFSQNLTKCDLAFSVTAEFDSDMDNEDLENPFHHEEGCPLAWKPPKIKPAWNEEVFKSSSPLKLFKIALEKKSRGKENI